jgi:hypothetical protein
MNPLRKFKEETENYENRMKSGGTVQIHSLKTKNVLYPVSGYKGFIPGKKALNKHGNTFRNTLKEIKFEQLTKNN